MDTIGDYFYTNRDNLYPTLMLVLAILKSHVEGDLDGMILPTICRMRHAYVMPTTRIASCKSTYNILTTDAHNTKNVVRQSQVKAMLSGKSCVRFFHDASSTRSRNCMRQS